VGYLILLIRFKPLLFINLMAVVKVEQGPGRNGYHQFINIFFVRHEAYPLWRWHFSAGGVEFYAGIAVQAKRPEQEE
jgi:hypothetical protein